MPPALVDRAGNTSIATVHLAKKTAGYKKGGTKTVPAINAIQNAGLIPIGVISTSGHKHKSAAATGFAAPQPCLVSIKVNAS